VIRYGSTRKIRSILSTNMHQKYPPLPPNNTRFGFHPDRCAREEASLSFPFRFPLFVSREKAPFSVNFVARRSTGHSLRAMSSQFRSTLRIHTLTLFQSVHGDQQAPLCRVRDTEQAPITPPHPLPANPERKGRVRSRELRRLACRSTVPDKFGACQEEKRTP
jgi:hypothetical protein